MKQTSQRSLLFRQNVNRIIARVLLVVVRRIRKAKGLVYGFKSIPCFSFEFEERG